MKIGIYGGTFNPIHMGHIQAARFASEILGLDRLLLVPTGVPPHKALDEDAPTPDQRLAMTELAAEAVGPVAEASDLELRRKGKSYTLDTVKTLRAKHPHARLYLLMGTDMYLTFHRWRDPEKLAKLCTLCAFGRSEADSEELFARQRKYLAKAVGADSVTIALPEIVDISSTRLREVLKRGEGREYLDPAVYGYILREGLYGVGADLKNLSLEDLRCAALSMLKRKRIPHVLGTEETAAKLALRWGEDEEAARRAALLHDCTKKYSREQHLEICRQYGIGLDKEEQREEKLLHAITGAAVAKHVFGVPPGIESAIRWHTTGKADMTTLEKIIYLADYIEPTRDFCDLTQLRALAFQDLDGAMLLGLEMAVWDLKERGVALHSTRLMGRILIKENRNEQKPKPCRPQ
ncbi:MAG: nicotinate (nicotinamide) nucleotide adenylyltransferase, partial [Oscillospiraceae bacterium]|nr:nicotinate (nicotinamide) nucleotide adenylyltransferase [Oscillospiraceae bacterium]